ncbi:MAG TPA: hypothetical protein VK689_13500 [Armatimonadota bacterium]|nr:hypothetical protein [Armatimonadota bacterium]
MLITLPASAHGEAAPTSVLDLEPLIAYARQCRADAVSLMPPPGADDLPNAAALLAMKNSLEASGLQVVGGSWRVAENAPVSAPAWQAETLFEARALVAAIGEAGVDPLVVEWCAPCEEPAGRQSLIGVLKPLVGEAERAGVRLAIGGSLSRKGIAALLCELDSRSLGFCLEAAVSTGDSHAEWLRSLALRLYAVRLPTSDPAPGADAARADTVRMLRSLRFTGPLHLQPSGTPVETARAAGLIQGLRMARD